MTTGTQPDARRMALSFYLEQLDAAREALKPFAEGDLAMTPDRIIDIHIALGQVEAGASVVRASLS